MLDLPDCYLHKNDYYCFVNLSLSMINNLTCNHHPKQEFCGLRFTGKIDGNP
jgi:hypothetical protein